MPTRTLETPPSILPLYARAAAPMIPGASLLPFIPGGGGEIPELDLELAGVRADAGEVAAYARVCGFALRDHLPPTYPHILAFPLQMAVMADGSFPFGAVGLVHIENSITQHRRIGLDEELRLTVRPTGLEPHPRGRTFSLVTEAWAGRQKAWEEVSTMLRRGGGDGSEAKAPDRDDAGTELEVSAEWRLGGDLGRRYAAVSGDRNPIHMHALDREAARLPTGDRARHVDRGPLPCRAREPPPRRLRASMCGSASRSSYPAGSSSWPTPRTKRRSPLRCVTQSDRPPTSTAA